MRGILSTTNSLKFGDAEGTEGTDKVEQIQENHGHIGGNQLTHNSVEFGHAKGNQVNQRQTNHGNIGDDMNCKTRVEIKVIAGGDTAKPELPVNKDHSFGSGGLSGRGKGKK